MHFINFIPSSKIFIYPFLLLFFFCACKKDPIISTNSLQIEQIKDRYAAKMLDTALTRRLSDSLTLTLIPEWEKVNIIKSEQGMNYYFPIKAISTINNKSLPATFINVQLFLLVKDGFRFYEARYIFEEGSDYKISLDQILSSFTGTLTLRNLELNKSYGFNYINGATKNIIPQGVNF